MKSKDIITIIELICIILILTIGIIVFFLNNRKKITEIKKFEFTYSSGSEIYAYVEYKIDCTNKCVASIKPTGVPENNARKVKIEKEKVKELEDILRKYKVEKWDGFQKYNKHILDGSSFIMHIYMEDNTTIGASGYMKFPNNFAEVSKELGNYFKEIYDSGTDNGIERI